jgi:hypothetical protein
MRICHLALELSVSQMKTDQEELTPSKPRLKAMPTEPKHFFALGLKIRGQLFWEQLVMLAVAALALALGASWGLPDMQRTRLLTADHPLTATERAELTATRDEYYRNLDAKKALEADHSESHTQPPPEAAQGEHGTFSAPQKLIFLRAYILGGSAVDERKPYSALSRMRPRHLDFDPRIYIYGGTYLYPLGGILFGERMTGLLTTRSDLDYYLDHPRDIRRMYLAGRWLNLLAFLGVLWLLGNLGNKIGGRVCGGGAMVLWLCSTIALNHAIVSKPHVYAAFWGLLSFYFLYDDSLPANGSSTRRNRKLVLSAAALGCAAGASLPAGLLALPFCLAIIDWADLRSSAKRIVLSGIVAAFVLLITNPYILISADKFLLMLRDCGSARGWGFATMTGGKLTSCLLGTFAGGLTFPASLLSAAGIVIVIVRGDRFLRGLAVGVTASLLLFGLTVAIPRIALFLIFPLCLFGGIGLAGINRLLARTPVAIRLLAALVVFLPSFWFAGLFVYDTISDKAWSAETEVWVQAVNSAPDSSIGVMNADSVDPTNLPPFPFFAHPLVDMSAVSVADRPDWVVLGNYGDDRKDWEAHPWRKDYRLVFVLGDPERRDAWPTWRMISESRIGGWVYRRISSAQ